MERILMCPRTEICYIYKIYVDNTKNDEVGVVKISSIENTDFYSCIALSTVRKLGQEGKLTETAAKRLQGIDDCLMIDQANNLVQKHTPDL